MAKYEIWFQDSHIMQIIEAKSASEARKIFNRSIGCKKQKIAESR